MKPPLTLDQCKSHRDALAAGVSPARLDYQPHEVIDWLLVRAERYEWLREHPAFETEAYLSNLKPEEFDEAVDINRGAILRLTFDDLVAKHCRSSA